MKKIIYTLAVLSSIVLTSCSGAVDSVLRTKFLSDCKTAGGMNIPEEHKASFDKYCECSADKVIGSMTKEELAAYDKDPNNFTPEQQAKLMEVVKPCMDDLQKAIMPAAQ